MGGGESRPEPRDSPADATPNPQTGWIATEFKEYGDKNVVTNTYKTLDRLGRGGFGTVYKVQHLATGITYAMKYISIDTHDSAIKEANIMMKLEHKSIAKVHKYFSVYDNATSPKRNVIALCIIMDFVEGENLRDILRKLHEPLPKVLVMEWFIIILQALSYIHEKRIFHRDIKPESILEQCDCNIIVNTKEDGDVDVVLVDFGLAAQQVLSQQLITVAGTYPYISPDILAADGKVPLNSKADMWALGCVLYEIWSKDSSFTISKIGMLYKFQTDPRFLEKLNDPSITLLLASMLEIDPAKRVHSTDLLNSDAIKGWRTAIESDHPDRNACPKSRLYVLPYISILKDKQAPFSYCLANMLFLSKWLDQQVAPVLLDRLNMHSSEKTIGLLYSLCKMILYSLLSGPFSETVAFQVCSAHYGLETLLRVGAFTAISTLCQSNFGFRSLECIGVQHFVRKLLTTQDSEEKVSGGLGVFEYLPFSSMPLSLYLTLLPKIERTPEKQIERLATLLTSHQDISTKLRPDLKQLKELVAPLLATQPSQLLLGLVHAILPPPRATLIDCTNHRRCTTTILGTNKYYQNGWLCRSCGIFVCRTCKGCHSNCKGVYLAALARCRCSEKKQCLCVGQNDTAMSVTSVLFAAEPELLPPPTDNVSWSHTLRFWEDTLEARSPAFVKDEADPTLLYRSKGISFMPSFGRLETISFLMRSMRYHFDILRAAICVGLTLAGSPPKERHMVGWDAGSWAYHGDDGRKWVGKGQSDPNFGPLFSTGDRVGCGVLTDGSVYFTLNGMYLGAAPSDPKVPPNSQIFATVSVTGFSAHLRLIFDRVSFAFSPTKHFDPITYLSSITSTFVNLGLLEALGSNYASVLTSFSNSTVHIDTITPLLIGYSIHNTAFADAFKNHPFSKVVTGATSVYSRAIASSVLNIAVDNLAHSVSKSPRYGPPQDNPFSVKNSPRSPRPASVPRSLVTSPAPSPPLAPAPSLQKETKSILQSTLLDPDLQASELYYRQMQLQQGEDRGSIRSGNNATVTTTVNLHVRVEGLPSEEFELVLPLDKMNMKGIQTSLQELRTNLDEESIGKSVDKIMKEVKNDTNSKLVRIMADSNVQILKDSDRIVVSFK